MKAVISIHEDELRNIIRAHLNKVAGVDKIINILFKATCDRDELPEFAGVEIQVELKERV